MRETLFSTDILGDDTFSGYTDGRTWNGWACPYFPFEQAQRLVAAWRDSGWKAGYDPKRDVFTFAAADGQAEADEPETFGGVEIGGKQLYPIGAGAWIWDEVTDQVHQSL